MIGVQIIVYMGGRVVSMPVLQSCMIDSMLYAHPLRKQQSQCHE